jgi:hypothetical protein
MLPSYEAGQAQVYVAEKGWRAKRSGDEIVLEVCPLCGGKDWRTYINDESGLWKCQHGKCGAVGNFYTLRKSLGDLPAADPYVPVAVAKKRHTAELLSFEVALEVDEDAKSYLASRGIDMATAKAWHFGVKTDEHGVKWLMIPYLVNDVIGDIKYRSLPPAPKQFHRLKGGDSILFGGHQLADAQGRTTLYLVEGELDCVTLWQHGYWPAVRAATRSCSAGTSSRMRRAGPRSTWSKANSTA